jgi:hypothetical protein
MLDPGYWENLLRAEWTMIYSAPFSFFAAVLVGWFVGWLILRAWYRRTIRIGEDRLRLIETQRDIEKGQKEGLRAAFLELKPDASVLAIEISHGDPDQLWCSGVLVATNFLYLPRCGRSKDVRQLRRLPQDAPLSLASNRS